MDQPAAGLLLPCCQVVLCAEHQRPFLLTHQQVDRISRMIASAEWSTSAERERVPAAAGMGSPKCGYRITLSTYRPCAQAVTQLPPLLRAKRAVVAPCDGDGATCGAQG
jgi:hypothetical protein